jgi:DNA end-binding protein Ku
MRSIWKGSISFGLVNIPISLYPATREEELRFHLLRKTDLSPINFKRVAQADGKTVEWADIVKGYEYEKGKFIVLRDEDFKRVDIEATHSIDIVDFVELDEINPMFFNKPYYVEPGRGGDRAYKLLQAALMESGRVGIAKVVIRTKQHLAALKPNGDILVLETMRFANEIVDAAPIKRPEGAAQGKKETEMARALIDSMTHPWDAKQYQDEYSKALLEVIDEKIAAGGKEIAVKAKDAGGKPATNVIDLVSVLQQSLNQAAGGKPSKGAAPKPAPRGAGPKAAAKSKGKPRAAAA